MTLGGAPYVRGGGALRPGGRARAAASAGLLADARTACASTALVTFWRRLTRDLREHRKPPLVLLRRGWLLMRAEPDVVAHAVSCGAAPMTPDQAYDRLSALSSDGRLSAASRSRSRRRRSARRTPRVKVWNTSWNPNHCGTGFGRRRP